MSDPESRRWRLQAFDGNDQVTDSTCIGDAALDEAMKRVESLYVRPRINVRLA